MNAEAARPQNPLGTEPVAKLLVKFAIPSVISMLVNALYNIVDQIFIGQGVGYLGNAATTVSFPIVSIVLAVGTLFGAGGSAHAAIKLGERHEREAEKTLGTVFVLLTGIGLLMALLGLLFLDPILKVFGATPNNMAYSRDYASIILLGVPFNLLGIGLSNMARTDGSPQLAMYSMVAGCALNVVLDPVYIFVLHWGVRGAAVATVTSQVISAGMLLHYFLRRGNMRLRRGSLRIYPHIFATVTALGISSCITQLASTILQIVMNNSLVFYGDLSPVGGDVALSAMGIVMKVGMIMIAINIGIGIGSQPILGFNRGANQPLRIKATYLIAASIATVVSILGWLACIGIPHVLLQMFGTADANFTGFAVKCMRVFNCCIFLAGFQIVSTSYFQATGQPLKASILSMMRQLILLIPLILTLPRIWGLDGILYAGPVSDIGAGLVILCFMAHEMRRLSVWIRQSESAGG